MDPEKEESLIDCEIVTGVETCTEPYQVRKIFLESEIFSEMSGLWQDIPVAEARPHPDYNLTARGLAVNDLMLLRLARPAVFNQFVSPVQTGPLSLVEIPRETVL